MQPGHTRQGSAQARHSYLCWQPACPHAAATLCVLLQPVASLRTYVHLSYVVPPVVGWVSWDSWCQHSWPPSSGCAFSPSLSAWTVAHSSLCAPSPAEPGAGSPQMWTHSVSSAVGTTHYLWRILYMCVCHNNSINTCTCTSKQNSMHAFNVWQKFELCHIIIVVVSPLSRRWPG